MALPLTIVYSPGYRLDLGAHVFPGDKYERAAALLRPRSGARWEEPRPATREELELVHHADWVERLLACRLRPAELIRLEVPWTPAIRDAVLLHVGGSVRAAEILAADGAAVAANLGGGFHHAFAGHGEGFCALNDIAVGIRCWQRRRAAQGREAQALVVDCDVHQGNGTAALFRGDASVFTLSLHQANNYPALKQASDLDVNLEDGVGDDEYLAALAGALRAAFARCRPALVWYVAGADPYREDQLGGLALSREGLRRRDDLMLAAARDRELAVAITLAGGYARRVEDTAAIHAATIAAAEAACAS